MNTCCYTQLKIIFIGERKFYECIGCGRIYGSKEVKENNMISKDNRYTKEWYYEKVKQEYGNRTAFLSKKAFKNNTIYGS